MVKVRFLEWCHMFTEQKTYNLNDIDELMEEQAHRLFKRGVVDILNDEEYLKNNEESTKQLSAMTMVELKEIAKKNDLGHAGLKKAELIEAIEEVL